jgi:hypothetical protein
LYFEPRSNACALIPWEFRDASAEAPLTGVSTGNYFWGENGA